MSITSSRADVEHQPCVLVINSSGGGIAGTLDSSYYKGCGERQGIEREVVVVGVQHGSDRHDSRPSDPKV